MRVSVIIDGIPHDYQSEVIEQFVKDKRIVQVTQKATDSGEDVDSDGLPDPAQYRHQIYLISDSAVFDATEMRMLISNLGI